MNTDEAPRGWIALTGGARPGGGRPGAVAALRVVLRSDDPEAAVMYGPFRRLHMLGDAARALADATGVRDCALGGPAGGPARGGCLRAELGQCACPGSAGGSDGAGGGTPDYPARVAQARDFLAGRTRAPVDVLRARMLAASEAWQFERAAVLRERVAALEWLAGRLERFHAGADRLTFVYRPLGGAGGAEHVYLLRRGTVRAECPAPAAPEDEAALAALARRVYAAPDGADGAAAADLPTHDLDEFYLVASWFRRHPEELARTSAPPAPPPATPPAAPAHPARRRGARRVAADAPER
jgi:hypothetical protein